MIFHLTPMHGNASSRRRRVVKKLDRAMYRAMRSIGFACAFISCACTSNSDATELEGGVGTLLDVGSHIDISAESKLQTNGLNHRPKRLDRRMKSQLALYVSELMRRADVPGASLAIVQNGKIVYLKGFGL